MKATEFTVRWTIGRVRREGFEALGLSIAGLHRIFGDDAEYIVCVNNIPLAEAQARTGYTRVNVCWLDVTAEFPVWMREYFGSGMAEGVGWKFAPIRLGPQRHELALDNDCIIWELPDGIRRWIATPG
jgi:hypothetical protein